MGSTHSRHCWNYLGGSLKGDLLNKHWSCLGTASFYFCAILIWPICLLYFHYLLKRIVKAILIKQFALNMSWQYSSQLVPRMKWLTTAHTLDKHQHGYLHQLVFTFDSYLSCSLIIMISPKRKYLTRTLKNVNFEYFADMKITSFSSLFILRKYDFACVRHIAHQTYFLKINQETFHYKGIVWLLLLSSLRFHQTVIQAS